MTPRRIAYFINVFPKLSETFIVGELAELKRRGVELLILSLRTPTETLRHNLVTASGLDKITHYDPERFRALLGQFQPQLLHAHFATEPTASARDFAAQLKIPFTFTAHGYDIRRKPPADFSARAEAAAAVVTVSQANSEHIVKNFAVSAEKIRVISCGIDTDYFSPGGRTKAASANDSSAPLILCVARLVPVKNLQLLLRTCACLRDSGVGFRCVTIGEGPARAELETLRNDLDLKSFVEMPGAATQDEVLRYWQQAQVGVLTSQNEGMPVALMEAAACGVPVVATNVGGIPELVEHERTGLLVPLNDERAFASAVARLIQDCELATSMGKQARARALETFSVTHQVDQLLDLWSEVMKQKRRRAATLFDPFNAANDSLLPSLALALSPNEIKEFKRGLPRIAGDGFVRVESIRVTRHKPGRRCVAEYECEIERAASTSEKVTLIGKVRARRYGNEGYRLLDEFWNAGFHAKASDQISVPEPIGVIPNFKMWFQRKVRGIPATDLFSTRPASSTDQGTQLKLAQKIGAAAHKIHLAKIPVEKTHRMADELRILEECFAKVAETAPDIASRLDQLLSACIRLGQKLPEPVLVGSHRDFYPAQVIVDDERIWILDFDLYCLGDPGLDVGNFLGHLMEQALRCFGDAAALALVEQELEESFIALAGESTRLNVRIYAALTLARHIFLSTKFAERQNLTMALLELTEARVAKLL